MSSTTDHQQENETTSDQQQTEETTTTHNNTNVVAVVDDEANNSNNNEQVADDIEKEEEEDQTVTEEERQWMIDDIKAKTADLQNLLLKYRQMEDDLKEQVLEMVLRDIHEQNIHLGINRRVQLAQQEMLSDTSYVGWAMKNGKGEFAEDSEERSYPNTLNTSTPGDAPKTKKKESDSASRCCSWKDSIINAVASAASTSSKKTSSSANSLSDDNVKLPDPKLLSSSLPLSTLILPPRIALVLSSSFQSLNDEESSMPDVLKARFASFLTLVEVWKQRVEAHCNNEPCALCLNGIPLLLGHDDVLLSGGKTLLSKPPYEEGLCKLLNLWLRKTNEKTSADVISDIFSTESSTSKSFFDALLKHGTNSDEQMATSVVGSSNDTLSLVPLSQLESSLLVYAVVSYNNNNEEGGVQVAAIEPVISSIALHTAKGFNPNAIRQQVDSFCQSVISPLMSSKVIPKKCVLTLSLQSSSSSTVIQDICELSPELPTNLLTWVDVCSILRQQQQQQQGSSTSSSSSVNNFLFRGQKSRVADIKDTIRNENEEEEQQQTGQQQNDDSNSASGESTNKKTVAKCFLQLVEDTLNFDEEKAATEVLRRQKIKDDKNNGGKSEVDSSSSISRFFGPITGVTLAAGAALVAGAFFALKKNNNKQ